MKKLTFGVLSACLLLASGGVVRADDQAEAKAIIAKAVKAVGDEAKIVKLNASTWKGKGKFYGLGDAVDYTGEWAVQGLDRSRMELQMEVMGMKINLTIVVNKDKGWLKVNDMLMDADEGTLAESKDESYAGDIASMAAFARKEPGLELSPLGESKVGGRTVLGVRVSKKGHPDVSLFIDKENGLVLKQDRRAKDAMSGEEFNQETFFYDYKSIDGIKTASRMEIKRDGKIYIESEFSDFKYHEKLDENLFQKP